MIEIKRNVMATQAKACWGCLHVGSVAVYLGFTLRREYGWRLELLTPLHRFRWNHGRWASAGSEAKSVVPARLFPADAGLPLTERGEHHDKAAS